MTTCTNCGATDQEGRFCVRCGLRMLPQPPAGPSGGHRAGPSDVTIMACPLPTEPPPGATPPFQPPISPQKVPTADPLELTVMGADLPPAQPGSWQPPPPFAPPPVGTGSGGSGRSAGTVALVVVAVAAVLVAGVGVWFLFRTPDDRAGGTALTQSAAPPPTAAAPTTDRTSPSGGGRSRATTSATPTTVPGIGGSAPTGIGAVGGAPAPATTGAPADPMGGPHENIVCGTGYIVQVASELDQQTFQARVATLRAQGTLPPDVKWTETSTSCGIFMNQRNVFVLYAGPFPDWVAACPARLAGPADAILKRADPAQVGSFPACICPEFATAHPPPHIASVGQQDVWVGELQRVLGAQLDYDVGSINDEPSIGDPGRWGIYTAETAAAVGRFQRDDGLPVTEQVDGATWAALQRAACR